MLYTFNFRGGKTRDFVAFNSRGQELDVDVTEEGGQRTVTLSLAGYEVNKPY
jgi:hypothetical protein